MDRFSHLKGEVAGSTPCELILLFVPEFYLIWSTCQDGGGGTHMSGRWRRIPDDRLVGAGPTCQVGPTYQDGWVPHVRTVGAGPTCQAGRGGSHMSGGAWWDPHVRT